MKKWIPILAILIVVAFASGCTAQTQTYNSNGITFQYPGDWSNTNTSSAQAIFGNSATILASLGKEGAGTGIIVMKIHPELNLNDVIDTVRSSATSGGYQLISETTRIVDGVNATVINEKSANGVYYTNVALQKNNSIYDIMIASPNSDQANVDMILNSFKVQ